jgi:hypothetical protein
MLQVRRALEVSERRACTSLRVPRSTRSKDAVLVAEL